MTIPQHIISILAAMSFSGNTSTLNGTLSRADYLTTNEILETLGGKWSKKQKCHVWTIDPKNALAPYLTLGNLTLKTTIETAKEKKKEFQFFGTPSNIADLLVNSAQLSYPYYPPESILEPSAGQGSLIQAIQRRWVNAKVDCYEIQAENREVLKTLNNVTIIGNDFLQADTTKKYDLIVSNPPFNKHQDILHIRKMFDCLKIGGTLITISSNHWRTASHKIDKAFKEWIESMDADVQEIEAGSFKESGTMMACNFIVLTKPNEI